MNKLDLLYKKAKRLIINNNDKIVIMSDCHRGEGNKNDNFLTNELIYEVALSHYYKNNYTYIELGDGDDMWEVKDYQNIIKKHLSVFKKIKKFYLNNRFLMIYGNHDISKKSKRILKKYFYFYYDDRLNKKINLLEHLNVYESLVMEYDNKKILLVHGHQVDFLNSNIWLLSRFLVRNIWRFLELIGFKAPVTKASNYKVHSSTEKRLQKWSSKNNIMLIAGHTHRPLYPKVKEGLYFNDGSCVSEDGITSIEIVDGRISLYKWIKIDNNVVLRMLISGNKSILDFF